MIPSPISLKEHGTDFLDGASPSLDPHPTPGGHPPHPRGNHQGRTATTSTTTASSSPTRPSSPPPPAKAPVRSSLSNTSATEAYLTQSGQLYIERHRSHPGQGLLPSDRPFALRNPRPVATSLSSGWWSRRWAFANLDDLMGLAENFISFIVDRVLTRRAPRAQDHQPRRRGSSRPSSRPSRASATTRPPTC